MCEIKVKIVKLIDLEPQPGIVEGQFLDAWGVLHKVYEKTPIISCENWIDRFPVDGEIRCNITKEWIDDNGRKLITVSTASPDDVETTDGKNEFDLLPQQLGGAVNE